MAALASAAPKRPPSLGMTPTDAMGRMDTAVVGNKHCETPNINHLAALETRFNDYYPTKRGYDEVTTMPIRESMKSHRDHKLKKNWVAIATMARTRLVAYGKGASRSQQAKAETISGEYGATYPNVRSDRFVFKAIILPDRKWLDFEMRVVRPNTGGPFPVVFYMHGDAWATGSNALNLIFKRIGLVGGKLSAVAAQLTAECICCDGTNGLYGAYDIGKGWFGRGDYAGTTDAEMKHASAIHLIKETAPDTFLCHCMADTTIDIRQSYRYAEATRNNGGNAEALAYPEVGHGFFNKNPYETSTTQVLLAHTPYVFGLPDKKPLPSANLLPAKEGEHPAVVPTARETNGKKWLSDRLDAVAKELRTRDLSKVRTLFLGDSITQDWLTEGAAFWRDSFADALNLGVAGDRTEHVLYRLEAKSEGGMGELDDPHLDPKVIVLMIGTNNLFSQRPDQIIAGINAVVARLRMLRPHARLVLCSILPVSKAELNETVVVPINRVIKGLREDPAVEWLDLYPKFVDENGVQRGGLFRDGVHPTEAGYRIWRNELEKLLGKMVKAGSKERVFLRPRH